MNFFRISSFLVLLCLIQAGVYAAAKPVASKLMVPQALKGFSDADFSHLSKAERTKAFAEAENLWKKYEKRILGDPMKEGFTPGNLDEYKASVLSQQKREDVRYQYLLALSDLLKKYKVTRFESSDEYRSGVRRLRSERKVANDKHIQKIERVKRAVVNGEDFPLSLPSPSLVKKIKAASDAKARELEELMRERPMKPKQKTFLDWDFLGSFSVFAATSSESNTASKPAGSAVDSTTQPTGSAPRVCPSKPETNMRASGGEASSDETTKFLDEIALQNVFNRAINRAGGDEPSCPDGFQFVCDKCIEGDETQLGYDCAGSWKAVDHHKVFTCIEWVKPDSTIVKKPVVTYEHFEFWGRAAFCGNCDCDTCARLATAPRAYEWYLYFYDYCAPDDLSEDNPKGGLNTILREYRSMNSFAGCKDSACYVEYGPVKDEQHWEREVIAENGNACGPLE